MKSDVIDRREDPRKHRVQTTENKSIVQRARAALLDTGDAEALAPFLSADLVQHRPEATTTHQDGVAGRRRPATRTEWLADVGAAQEPLAGMQAEVGRVLADADHVMVHSRRRLPGVAAEVVVVDICRIEDGLIAEIWEIIEPVSAAAANLRRWSPPAPVS